MNIKELAEQAGFEYSSQWEYWTAYENDLKRFAELVAAAALAQPEQEPVVTEPTTVQLRQVINGLEHCFSGKSKLEFLRVWIRDWAAHKLEKHTAPPKREWVGLTDEEIDWIFGLAYADDMELLRTIEAALKEKNT